MTRKEEQEVLARLAASDVASQVHQEINSASNNLQRSLDEWEALMNITKVLKVRYLEEAEQLCARLIAHLQGSDLTINLRAMDFFAVMPGAEFNNTWQRDKDGGGYTASRDRTEENMFGYSSKKTGVKDVIGRIKKFGSFSGGKNNSFEASFRPRYAALNYACQKNGAATKYGSSFIVLKEHIKHNSTFTAKDSFHYESTPDAGNKIANYHHMDRLIANMPPDTLKKLYNAVAGASLELKNPIMDYYVEAQVHATIQFHRDVKKIYVANSELLGSNNNSLRETIEKFTKKNGIRLEYI